MRKKNDNTVVLCDHNYFCILTVIVVRSHASSLDHTLYHSTTHLFLTVRSVIFIFPSFSPATKYCPMTPTEITWSETEPWERG